METKKLKVVPLSEVTDEEFAPFGQIMGRVRGTAKEDPSFLYWTKNVDLGDDAELVDCGLFQVDNTARKVRFLERHLNITESFIPVEGEGIFILGPPDNSTSKPDVTKLKAFYFNGKLGISLHKGTWHWPPIPMEEFIRLILVRKGKIGELKEVVDLKDVDLEDIVLSFGK